MFAREKNTFAFSCRMFCHFPSLLNIQQENFHFITFFHFFLFFFYIRLLNFSFLLLFLFNFISFRYLFFSDENGNKKINRRNLIFSFPLTKNEKKEKYILTWNMFVHKSSRQTYMEHIFIFHFHVPLHMLHKTYNGGRNQKTWFWQVSLFELACFS